MSFHWCFDLAHITEVRTGNAVEYGAAAEISSGSSAAAAKARAPPIQKPVAPTFLQPDKMKILINVLTEEV